MYLVARRQKIIAICLGCMFVLFNIVGCTTNPTNRYAQARVTLTTTQDSVMIAHQAGIITDDQMLQADPLIQATRAALIKAEMYLPDGGQQFNNYMGIIDAMLIRLEQLVLPNYLQLE